MSTKLSRIALTLVIVSGAAASQAFTIVLNANSTLAGNSAALAAFQRAAHNWETKFKDNVTVTINAGLASLGTNIIGSTSSVTLQAGYTTIRNAMVADAAGDGPSNAIVASLPSISQFSAFVPSGKSISGNIAATKANLKALGFAGLDQSFGAADATINFSTNFAFDYNDADGVDNSHMSFETVATHEIGHALGFVSGVDGLDTGGSTMTMRPLDLFRFSTGANVNAGNFATTARDFRPGANTAFNDTTNEYRFSTGVNMGDGNQASHWKADELTGHNIGIMDPTLAFGQIEHITNADLRAFDLIGYNLAPTPEPASMAALAIGGIALIRRRRSSKR